MSQGAIYVTRTDTQLRAACTNGATPACGAGVEDNRHWEVEHPDAWAHRNLDELDRAYATSSA